MPFLAVLARVPTDRMENHHAIAWLHVKAGPTTMFVRLATTADAAAIAALNAHVQSIHADAFPWRFKQPSALSPSGADIARILAQPNYFAFVAEMDGAPAGYLTAEIVRRDDTPFHFAYVYLHVHHIAVDPAARRQGIARAMMDAAKAHGAREGIEIMSLDVWDFNDAARAFFAGYGLVPAYLRLWNKTE